MGLNLQSYKGAELISSLDDAIKDGYDEYAKSYYDRSKLVMHAGKAPAVFHVKTLTPNQLDLLDGIIVGRVRDRECLRLALRSIEGLEVGDLPVGELPRSPQNGIVLVDREWFDDKLGRYTDLMSELASMVMRLSSPDPT